MSYQFDSRIATCSSESWVRLQREIYHGIAGQWAGVDDEFPWAKPVSGWDCASSQSLWPGSHFRFGLGYYLGTLNPPDYAYADVSAEEATPCRCNTVSFMLISACAICQSGQNADWISYSRNCWGTVTQPSQGVYPGTLPSGIAVPAWAYWVPGRPNFQFSTAIAKDFAGPDSTRPGSSPSTSTTPPSSTSTEAAGTTTNAKRNHLHHRDFNRNLEHDLRHWNFDDWNFHWNNRDEERHIGAHCNRGRRGDPK
ncbi:hypothetical protein FA13DRAFT_1792463 [Coprinellus micaceus]|uniref:Uncharacterized protein n=1 Tax=Coprinellus micaceus TaxID=71717 RepID=A0A4Y7T8P7_COPMI|nr:hypothetical protein FA13DRAFT_1792463 [Coprinellus micaceus]